MNGTLRDSSGAVISGGTVTVRNRATQIERTTTSNQAGNFVVLDVPPGNYTLEARQSGFAPARLESFDLAVNQTLTIDLTLAVGTVEQSLTVQEMATHVENSTPELGGVITSKSVVDLPLNGRNFTQLLSLTLGTVPANVSQNAGNYAGNAGASASFPSVNGQTNRSNFFMLDGGTTRMRRRALTEFRRSLMQFRNLKSNHITMKPSSGRRSAESSMSSRNQVLTHSTAQSGSISATMRLTRETGFCRA